MVFHIIRWAVIISLLCCNTVLADEKTKQQKVWDIISYTSVGIQITYDSLHSWKSDNRKKEFTQQIIRIGATSAITRITKHYVHKTRPDGSDNKSFFSGHTAQSADAMYWASGKRNIGFAISLTVVTGAGRVKANRHHVTDVLVGAAVGSLVGIATEKLVK